MELKGKTAINTNHPARKPAKPTKALDLQATPPPVDLEDQIRRRAYELWEQGGREHGHDTEHWLQAAREVTQPRA